MEISSSIAVSSAGDVSVAEPPSRDLQACVIVPARNEEELLPLALRALAGQKSLDGAPLPRSSYEVIVLDQ